MSLPIYHDPVEEALWRVVGFGEGHYPAGRPYRWANAGRTPSSQCVAQLTLEGRMYLDEPAGRSIVSAGQLLLFRYGDRSVYGKVDLQDTYACRWVNLDGLGLAEHIGALRMRHGSVLSLGTSGPAVDQLGRLIALAEPASGTPRVELARAVHGFVMALFEHAEHGRRQTLSPAEQAVAQMLENPFVPWSLKRVAAEARVSREHLTRVFTQKVGRPPHRHLTEARVGQALRLLRETDLPLAGVAEQSGFESVHNLSRHVRRVSGRSPTALRESGRG